MPPSHQYQPTTKVGYWSTLEHSNHNAVRLLELPQMEWIFEPSDSLRNYNVAICTNGGPIALSRKGSSEVAVFTSIGSIITPFKTVSTAEIVFMCWNCKLDHLIVATIDGSLYFLNASLEIVATTLRIDKPTYFCASSNGLICTAEGGKIVAVECVAVGSGEYRLKAVAEPVERLRSTPPSSCLAISCDVSDSGYEELFIAPQEEDIDCDATLLHVIFATPAKCVDMKLKIAGGSILRMSLSMEMRVALLSTDGSLWCAHMHMLDIAHIGRVDLHEPQSGLQEAEDIPEEATVASANETLQLLWCGDECIALAQWHLPPDEDSKITIFAPTPPNKSDYFSNIPEEFVCVQECDGFRVISFERLLFVQRVPEQVYRAAVQLKSASAQLIASYDQYMLDDPSSVGGLREISSNQKTLVQAIEDCIRCASFEVNVLLQQRYLRIATYGKGLCKTFEADDFVLMCRYLRVLNAVMSAGMQLTFDQFKMLTVARLTERLIQEGFYQLAYAVCCCLDHQPNDVLIAWAKQKINSNAPPNELAQAIIEKFGKCHGLSLSAVAEAAHFNKKHELALLLLDKEPYPESQVPVLLRMQHDEIALTKAVESGNPDLVFHVITQLIAQRGAAASTAIMRNQVARDMLLSYCLCCDSQRYVIAQFLRDHPGYKAYIDLLQFFRDEDRLRKNFIEARRHDGWELIMDYKASAIQTAAVDLAKEEDGKNSTRLLKLQLELNSEVQVLARSQQKLEFLSASVAQTIRLLFESNLRDKAEALAKRFGVPEKMLWWIKLQALVKLGDLDTIDKMGGGGAYRTSKVKSPIGFVPFVQELRQAGHLQRASNFIFRVPDLLDRLELYVSCEAWGPAAKDCIGANEQQLLVQLKERARGNAAALDAIDRATKQS